MAGINTVKELLDSGKVIGISSLQEGETNLLRDIQAKLKAIGAYSGNIDGLYGSLTEKALIRFCDAVFLDNMQTQLLGPTFAQKLLAAPPPRFNSADAIKSVRFIRPVEGIVTSEFGYRVHPITGKFTLHKGIDIGGNAGKPVRASADGVVVVASFISGYGNFVEIEHSGKSKSAYAHLASFKVKVGERIDQGQQVGIVGATGGATGPHLHFEVLENGEFKNPRHYVNF